MTKVPREQLHRFEEWVNRYAGIVARTARLHAENLAESEDLSQEMLVQLWRSVPGFDGKCAVSTWIYRVCLNTALTWKRKAGRRNRREQLGKTLICGDVNVRNQGTGATEDRIEALYAAIRKLPPTDRNLIQLSLDGLSYREMSEVTGLTESGIGTKLTRARQQLAILIEKE